MKFMLIAALMIVGLQARAVVFGVDNRVEVNQAAPDIRELARSTAVLVINGNRTIDNVKGTFDLDAAPIGATCSSEHFAWDPSLDYSCTGFLVAPDLLITAGHCVYAVNTPNQERVNETKDGCETLDWAFDYATSATNPMTSPVQLKGIPLDHLFHCKQIIYATQTERAPFVDYALIQLDRPAFGRTPFKISAAPLLTPAEPVEMIGYDNGMPAKYRDQAHVTLNNPVRDSFLTTLDAFDGDSGGPVFNSNHEVVGILIGGSPVNSFYTDKTVGCDRVNRCSEDGSSCLSPDDAGYDAQVAGFQGVGAEVQRIAPIVALLKRLANPN